MTTSTVPGSGPDRPPDVRPDLRAWHATGSARPAASFATAIGIWLAALAVGLVNEGWSVRAALVLPLSLAAGWLFTIGHDAGHGSFTTSPLVNAVVGRLALVPSLHVFGLWRAHHDRHHRYTNLRSRDFVWTPTTVAEYRALPRGRRTLHRLYRHPSGLGLGLHYTVEIWGPRMLWPRARADLGPRSRLLADAALLYGALAGLALSAWVLVVAVDPSRAGDLSAWASAAGWLVVVPLMGAHWLIGFVIYFNHTHPDIAWYDDPAEWSRHDVQLEGSAGLRFAGLGQAVFARRIMNHTAHHVDPGVPLRRLPEAQRHLVDGAGDRIVSYPWSATTRREILLRCKLYDYETRRWLTYAAAQPGR